MAPLPTIPEETEKQLREAELNNLGDVGTGDKVSRRAIFNAVVKAFKKHVEEYAKKHSKEDQISQTVTTGLPQWDDVTDFGGAGPDIAKTVEGMSFQKAGDGRTVKEWKWRAPSTRAVKDGMEEIPLTRTKPITPEQGEKLRRQAEKARQKAAEKEAKKEPPSFKDYPLVRSDDISSKQAEKLLKRQEKEEQKANLNWMAGVDASARTYRMRKVDPSKGLTVTEGAELKTEVLNIDFHQPLKYGALNVKGNIGAHFQATAAQSLGQKNIGVSLQAGGLLGFSGEAGYELPVRILNHQYSAKHTIAMQAGLQGEAHLHAGHFQSADGEMINGVALGASALAGVKVSATTEVEFVKGLKGNFTVNGIVGAGAEAEIHAQFNKGTFEYGHTFGTALGHGGGLSWGYKVNPAELANTILENPEHWEQHFKNASSLLRDAAGARSIGAHGQDLLMGVRRAAPVIEIEESHPKIEVVRPDSPQTLLHKQVANALRDHFAEGKTFDAELRNKINGIVRASKGLSQAENGTAANRAQSRNGISR